MVEAEFLPAVPAAVAVGVPEGVPAVAVEKEPVAAELEPVGVAPPLLPPETILPVAPGFWPGTPVGAKVPGLPLASVMVKRVVQALTPASLVTWMK